MTIDEQLAEFRNICKKEMVKTYQQGREDEQRKLLTWLMEKEYFCQVTIDEDFDGNRETVVQYLDVDEVLEEYGADKGGEE